MKCSYCELTTMVCSDMNTNMSQAGTDIYGLFDVCRLKKVGTKAACYKNPDNPGLIDHH